jgi:hypothetical protein
MRTREKKQILLEKFVNHILQNYIKIFEHNTLEEMINEPNVAIEKEFIKFIGKEKVSIYVYESINKSKFIELALSYVLNFKN